MATKEVVASVAVPEGWTDATIVDLLCHFLDSQIRDHRELEIALHEFLDENSYAGTAIEEEHVEELLQDIEEVLTYKGEGEDTSNSMSAEDIAAELKEDAGRIDKALHYYNGELDKRFYFEMGLYSRS